MTIKIDEIIRSRRKTIALVITPDARLVVRTPLRTPQFYIHWLVGRKQAWIDRMQQTMRSRQALYPGKQFQAGESFQYLGAPLVLQWVETGRGITPTDTEILVPKRFFQQPEKAIRSWYRHAARQVLVERVRFMAQTWGYQYQSVRITDAHRRWGSCGFGNTLNFAWRLIMAPLPVLDYVVLHELAHTRIKNHSRAFWAQVAATLPDYVTHRNWLKTHQHLLEW